MDGVDLLIHPVRLRVLHALSGGRELTSSQLREHLPDVPKATAYRHIGVLADAGVLEVVGEQHVRGILERTYRLRRDRAGITPAAAAAMSADDHRRAFVAALAVLLAEFDNYLGDETANPVADSVSYRQATLWLSRDERTELVDRMREVLLEYVGNEPVRGRDPHLLSTVFFPSRPPGRTGSG